MRHAACSDNPCVLIIRTHFDIEAAVVLSWAASATALVTRIAAVTFIAAIVVHISMIEYLVPYLIISLRSLLRSSFLQK